MVGGSSDPFLIWFAEWGQVVYFFAQMVFWAAIGAAAIVVALQYRRFVSHKVGARKAGKAEPTPDIFAE
ncbi:MAG: hypothetical protein ACYC6J_08550 [Coriobacteriia bacterium]